MLWTLARSTTKSDLVCLSEPHWNGLSLAALQSSVMSLNKVAATLIGIEFGPCKLNNNSDTLPLLRVLKLHKLHRHREMKKSEVGQLSLKWMLATSRMSF